MNDYVKEYMLTKNDNHTNLIKSKIVRYSILEAMIPEIIDNKLTSSQRTCIMYYIAGHTQNEIAENLGISQPTVSRHIKQSKQAINEILTYCFHSISVAIREYIPK